MQQNQIVKKTKEENNMGSKILNYNQQNNYENIDDEYKSKKREINQ